MKAGLVPELCGCILVSHRAPCLQWIPTGSRGQGDAVGSCRGGGGFGKLRVLRGSWKISPAKAAVVIIVVLNRRAGTNGSYPGAMGRGGGEEKRE